jgi:hypothetical protein
MMDPGIKVFWPGKELRPPGRCASSPVVRFPRLALAWEAPRTFRARTETCGDVAETRSIRSRFIRRPILDLDAEASFAQALTWSVYKGRRAVACLDEVGRDL